MQIQPTRLSGVFRIVMEPNRDERGWFARSFCANEFEAAGLNPCVVQCNVSYSRQSGTLRGLHFQRSPHAEVKLVRCVSGAIYDVAVDVRKESPTFGRWEAFELSSKGLVSIYVGEGFAHGFVTLADDTCVIYNVSSFYNRENEAGVLWNDPQLGIPWPVKDPIVSAKDAALPSLRAAAGRV
jgi:dTDP-4-dehydrorhamnose 3,5-epimerase